MRDCAIHARREFKSFRWHDVILERCQFRGRYTGCDFGNRPDAYLDDPVGAVSNCDFTKAKLHLCRFFNSDMSGIRLAGWPTITILDPTTNATDWLAIPLPKELSFAQQVLGDAHPGESAIVFDVEQLCKKMDVAVGLVRPLLANKNYIVG